MRIGLNAFVLVKLQSKYEDDHFKNWKQKSIKCLIYPKIKFNFYCFV